MMMKIVCTLGYGAMIGATNALYRWLYPPEVPYSLNDGTPQGFGALFWPVTLPAVAAHRVLRRLFAHVDAKRAEAKRQAEDLKRRVEELEREIREGQQQT